MVRSSRSSESHRLARLAAQVCGGEIEYDPQTAEYNGVLLPDGTNKRALPVVSVTDPDSLIRKYEQERDKRLAAIEKQVGDTDSTIAGMTRNPRLSDLAKTDERFRKMLADPWMSRKERPAVNDEVDYLIQGCGYGGLLAAARMRQNGVPSKDIRMLDVAGEFGGTWYWNRYPGAMCDVEAYVYMPLCDEIGYVPKEKYAHQPEMMDHSKKIAEFYGLYENCLLGTNVESITWDDAATRWVVTTDRGDSMRARFVCLNFGTLQQPKLPGVPGVLDFQGHMWHTSRWDYDYTGGSSAGNLHKLADKVVGIIGTGATAVQVIPHVGAAAKHLYVFQRTPSTIDVRNNHKTSPEYASEFMSKPGWQRERQLNFMAMTEIVDPTNLPVERDLVDDGWTNHSTNLLGKFATMKNVTAEQVRTGMELADLEHMEGIRARTSVVVKDQKTADALKPYYRIFCKRPCFHDDYLETFNRPNVTLVDTDGHGVQAMTKKGVVANGQEYELDCVVLATGFEIQFIPVGFGDVNLTARKLENTGMTITGKNGQTLFQKWKDGPRTLRGFTTRGFPNLFFLNGPQGVLTNNFIAQMDETTRQVGHMIGTLRKRGLTRFDVSQKAEDDYSKLVFDGSTRGQKFLQSCTPGYYNNEGRLKNEKTYMASYPGGQVGGGGASKYFKEMEALRDADNSLEGLEVS